MFLSSFSISHSAVYGCQLSPDASLGPPAIFGATPASFSVTPTYARHPHQFRHPAIRLGTLIIINSK